MSKRQIRGGTKPTIRRNRPVLAIGNFELEGTLPSVVVHLRLSEGGAFRKLRDYCDNPKHRMTWEELDVGVYAIFGLPDDLLEMCRGRFWVKDWNWDHNARVMGASGAGENPKRVKEPRFTPTAKEGVKVLRKIAREDEAHEGAGKPAEKQLHGDETLDKCDIQKGQEAADYWKSIGMKAPVCSVGPTGKVL